MKIVLDGCPVSQSRMKFVSRGGFGRAYDPREKEKVIIRKQMIEYKNNCYPEFEMFEHPRISFIFHMPIPKSLPKKDIGKHASGLLKHEKKPDIDNFVKLYLDCLDGIVFDGDQKVQLGACVKLYHPFPKTLIIIQEASQFLSELEVDPLTWFCLFGKESGRCSYAEMVSQHDSLTPDYLKSELSSGMIYPHQAIESSEPVPTVLDIVASSVVHQHLVRNHMVDAG